MYVLGQCTPYVEYCRLRRTNHESNDKVLNVRTQYYVACLSTEVTAANAALSTSFQETARSGINIRHDAILYHQRQRSYIQIKRSLVDTLFRVHHPTRTHHQTRPASDGSALWCMSQLVEAHCTSQQSFCID